MTSVIFISHRPEAEFCLVNLLTSVATKDLEILIEKGLLWLQGDTAQWEVHYAFFAKAFGKIAVDTLAIDELYLRRKQSRA